MLSRRFFPLAFAGFVIAMFLVAGCSMDSSGPSAPGRSAGELEFVTYELPEAEMAAKSLSTWTDAEVIDPDDGGRLKIGNGGLRITLTIGGIEGGTKKMTLRLASHRLVMVDIGPSGTKFNPPARLVAKGSSINLPEGEIALYYDDNGTWVVMSSVRITGDGKDITLSAALRHCSRYAFGYRR